MLKLTRTKITLIVVVVLLIVGRAVLPSIILGRLNAYLATFSPVYSIHVGGLDLGLLTFSYTGHNTEAFYKKDGHKFFLVKKTHVQISFTELFRGRILTNVRIDDAGFTLTKALIESRKDPDAKPRETARKASEKLFPLKIAVLEIHNGSFDFADFIEQNPALRWRVREIDATVKNINPDEKNPDTTFVTEGYFLENTPFKAQGLARRLDDPLAWKMNFEMKDFNLVAANPMLWNDIPFTFTKGKLDLFSEVKSQDAKISGYLKLFLKDVAVLNKNEKFKNVKHFFFEIFGAFGNFVLKDSDKVTATKLSFHEENGALKIDAGEALKTAVKNRFEEPLKPGFDHTVELK